MKTKHLYITLIGLLFSGSILSQVTIGSKIAPNTGALLDLKQFESTGGNFNASKGLGLPRVELTKVNDLSDIGVTEGDGQAQVGMVVYHTTNNVCNLNPNGVYVWTGLEWTPLTSKSKVVTTSLKGMSQPNSYISNGKAQVIVPIEKAFDIWNGASWQDENSSTLLGTKTLTNLTAEVVWMDAENVICSIDLATESDLRNSKIKIGTSKYGNAVVALKSSNQIVWSWHIWVTPNTQIIQANGYTWMDRNLGATSASLSSAQSKGNHYQWGLKDPFPNKTDWISNNTEPTLYKLGGGTVSLDKNYAAVTTPQTNLIKSIESPSTFIKSSGSPYFDWYSSADQWKNRWNDGGQKSVSDPCPEGWKVPDSNPTISPWNSIMVGNAADYTTNKGWSWAGFGFYPAAGSRIDSSANLTNGDESSGGYLWTSSYGMGLSIAMYFNQTVALPRANSYRAGGFSVRCVKE